MPFFARSFFSGHQCKDEKCKICAFIRLCDNVREGFRPIFDEIKYWLTNQKIMKIFLPSASVTPNFTLTGMHVRMND